METYWSEVIADFAVAVKNAMKVLKDRISKLEQEVAELKREGKKNK